MTEVKPPKKRSREDLEKAKRASHEEVKKVSTWIPEDDSQYEVTFKTWIVASVRLHLLPLGTHPL